MIHYTVANAYLHLCRNYMVKPTFVGLRLFDQATTTGELKEILRYQQNCQLYGWQESTEDYEHSRRLWLFDQNIGRLAS